MNSMLNNDFGKSFSTRRNVIKSVFFIAIVIIIASLGIKLYTSTHIETVEDCKVIELQQQQLITGTKDNVGTEIRYLIITDKGTFVCENSLVNLKFNNSDIFWRLKKDSTYTFKVAGIGKTIITDYKNILEFK